MGNFKSILQESDAYRGDKEFYHGSSALFPFEEFDKRAEGSGIVSRRGKRYGGFFFTTEKDNAGYYTENWMCTVSIRNLVVLSPEIATHPPQAMKIASTDRKNYVLQDVVDGDRISDIAIVPMSNLRDINILRWEFVGDYDSWKESMDEIVFQGEDPWDNPSGLIEDVVEMMGGDFRRLMKIPEFKKYVNDHENEF